MHLKLVPSRSSSKTEAKAAGSRTPEITPEANVARPDLQDAARRLLRMLEEEDSSTALSMAELWTLYYSTDGQHLTSSERSLDAWSAISKITGRDGISLCDRPAMSITSEVAEELRTHLSTVISRFGKPLAPATRNRYFIVLRRALNWGVENKKLPYNPLRVALEVEDNVRQTVVRSEEDFQRLLDCCDPWNRALALIYFDGGMRRMEGIDLQRHNLIKKPDGGGWIVLYHTKTKKAREVCVTQRAVAALEALPDRGTYFFARPDGKQPYHKRYLYQRFRLAVARSGLRPAPGENITWHTLRHSFCYVRREIDHWSESSIMAQTGHTTEATFRRYGIGDVRARDEGMIGVEARIAGSRIGPKRAPDPSQSPTEKQKLVTG